MKSAALPVFSSQEWLSAKVLVSDTKENHSPPTARPLYHKATEHADYAGLDMQSHQGNIRVDKLHTNHNIYVYIYMYIYGGFHSHGGTPKTLDGLFHGTI